jgi:hypothetical protein
MRKRRIPDGNGESGLFSYSELRRWKPSPVSIKDHVSWALLQQALIMYWHILAIWNSTSLVASIVAELDDTLTRFTDDRKDSVQASHELPSEVFVWKMTIGEVGSGPTL